MFANNTCGCVFLGGCECVFVYLCKSMPNLLYTCVANLSVNWCQCYIGPVALYAIKDLSLYNCSKIKYVDRQWPMATSVFHSEDGCLSAMTLLKRKAV